MRTHTQKKRDVQAHANAQTHTHTQELLRSGRLVRLSIVDKIAKIVFVALRAYVSFYQKNSNCLQIGKTLQSKKSRMKTVEGKVGENECIGGWVGQFVQF